MIRVITFPSLWLSVGQAPGLALCVLQKLPGGAPGRAASEDNREMRPSFTLLYLRLLIAHLAMKVTCNSALRL